MEGPDALAAVIGQLEGFEAPAGAWETEILPARVDGLRAGLARRAVPRRARRLDAAAPAHGARRRRRAGRRRCARRRSPCSRAAMLRSGRRCRRRRRRARRAPRAQAVARCHPRARRVVLRRAGRRHRPAAPAGRGGAGRAGGARPGHLRQLRGLARAAGAVGSSASRSPAARRRRALPFGMEDAGRWALARRARAERRPQREPRRSSMSRARCCAATAWCSGGCSSARPTGCRRGATCCASIAGSRRAARSAAGASSPASPASSSRCPRRSACCARCAASRRSDALVSLSGADPLNLVGILTPGPEARRAHRQPRALSRRRAGRAARRRRGAVPRDARYRHRMAGAQGAAARLGARAPSGLGLNDFAGRAWMLPSSTSCWGKSILRVAV